MKVLNLLSSASLVCAIVLTSTAALAAGTVYDNLPLDEGNFSVFHKVTDKTIHTAEVTSVDASEYRGGGWYESVWNGIFSDSLELWDHVNSATAWTHDASQWSQVFDFSASPGTEWNFRADPCNSYDVRVISDADAVQTPAHNYVTKSFGFGQTPDFNATCAPHSIIKAYFAQGTGLVSYEGVDYDADLMYAKVEGNVVAHTASWDQRTDGNQVEHTLLVNGNVAQAGTLFCLQQPCVQPEIVENQFAIVLENTGDQTVVYDFGTGQQFEFDLFDADTDEFLTRWSSNQFFTQASSNLTLAPGEHRVLFAEIPMMADNGDRISGDVRVTAYLAASGAPKLDGTFSVNPL